MNSAPSSPESPSDPRPADETLVLPRHQVRLDLPDRVETHAHDDQQGGAAQVEGDAEAHRQQRRKHADRDM